MKVIVLTGLVTVEKAQLSLDLANKAVANGLSVKMIDNIARQPIVNNQHLIEQRTGDILPQLPAVLANTDADVVIVALSEQTHPEKLFVTLDALTEQFTDSDIYSLALIDTRTCDCFPNVRQALEMYADATIMLPYQLDEVLTYVDFT
ncbi:MAG: hypothetical protein AAF846_06955 [Chloroflexota bacterium]